MKKRKYALVLMLILALSGCGSVENSKVNKDIEAEMRMGYDFPNVYSNDSYENIEFLTEVVVDENIRNKTLYETEALLCEPNHDKAYAALFQNKEIVEQYEYDTENGKEIYLYSSDSNSFYSTYKSLFMTDSLFTYIANVFFLEEDEAYNADLYLTGENFAFMNIENAYNQVATKLSDIDLDLGETKYTCYSLNHIKMQENEYAVGIDGEEDSSVYKQTWTEADDSYFFSIFQTCQNLTVHYPYADVFTGLYDANAPIQVIYSAQGIQLLDVDRIFKFNITDQPIQLAEFEQIADAVGLKYGMLLVDTNYVVKKAQLFWRPMLIEGNSYELLPAWEITIVDKVEGKESQMYVNAITAEEIL